MDWIDNVGQIQSFVFFRYKLLWYIYILKKNKTIHQYIRVVFEMFVYVQCQCQSKYLNIM